VDSGAAALAALQHAAKTGEAFRLILLDARMPEMDGFALAERIKKHAEFADTTIMMLTSDNRRGDIARCRELGLAAYLIKPIQQTELLRTIVEALGFSGETKRKSVHAAPQVASNDGKPLRILLADDNAVNRKVAVCMLEKQGHSVVVANNGKEAIAALQAHTFDLVLMDVMMPEMGGFEATHIIRKGEKRTGRHLPIIAMTASAMKGDRERCLEAGMDGYIAKPVQAKDLQEAINCVRSRAEQSAADHPNKAPVHVVLDKAALFARVDGDREFLMELIELFDSDCPGQMTAIRDALARGDAARLHGASHSLKGSVSNFFAHSAIDAALRLEMRGRAGDLKGAEIDFADLEQAIASLRSALGSLVEEIQPSGTDSTLIRT
jgi:two-component system sensor histidine kinase/response regulator